MWGFTEASTLFPKQGLLLARLQWHSAWWGYLVVNKIGCSQDKSLIGLMKLVVPVLKHWHNEISNKLLTWRLLIWYVRTAQFAKKFYHDQIKEIQHLYIVSNEYTHKG